MESMAGVLQFRDIPGESDIDGILHHSRTSSASGVFAAGYDETLTAIGSRFVSPGFSEIPLDTYSVTVNNAIASFTGGTFGGISYVFTWESKGKMTAPKLPTYKTSGKMKNKTGFFTGKYSSFDSANGFAKTASKFRGVVIQKQKITSGQELSNGRTGRYSIAPNDTGDVAPSVVITPRKKDLSAAAASYIVQIAIGSEWQVVIPDDVTWVTTDVALGAGNGQVTVTVEGNATGFPREAKIRIAGLEHKIEQD